MGVALLFPPWLASQRLSVSSIAVFPPPLSYIPVIWRVCPALGGVGGMASHNEFLSSLAHLPFSAMKCQQLVLRPDGNKASTSHPSNPEFQLQLAGEKERPFEVQSPQLCFSSPKLLSQCLLEVEMGEGSERLYVTGDWLH